jgi:nucleotide-binding universal stress UspA family protein
MSIETKHILVALDDAGEPRKGMEKAIYLAKLSGAKITGVNVIVVSPTLASTVTKYYRDYLAEKAQEMLDRVKESCEKQGIQLASKILDGSSASKIAEFAEEEKVDLVIVGSRGLGGMSEAILGSVATSIVHKSKVSVLVVK